MKSGKMNQNPSAKYLNWVADNYATLQLTFKKFCSNQRFIYDDDIFSDTILKVAEQIEKQPLKDSTPNGYLNYTFLSFKNNLKRERQYSRVKNRTEMTGITDAYEDYFNQHNDSSTIKVLKDLKQDFSILYVIKKAEQAFPAEWIYCFKLKFLYKLTYKQLQEKCPHIKNTRQKTIDVLHWLKENLTKEELDGAFDDFKGDFL